MPYIPKVYAACEGSIKAYQDDVLEAIVEHAEKGAPWEEGTTDRKFNEIIYISRLNNEVGAAWSDFPRFLRFSRCWRIESHGVARSREKYIGNTQVEIQFRHPEDLPRGGQVRETQEGEEAGALDRSGKAGNGARMGKVPVRESCRALPNFSLKYKL